MQIIIRAAALGGVVLALAACSGNMGSGATPPISAGGAPVGGGVGTQNTATGAVPGTAGATPQPTTLTAQSKLAVTAPTRLVLPSAGGFSGTLCIAPTGPDAVVCPSSSAAASPVPSPGASATPAASTSATPHSVMITPPSKEWLKSGVKLGLTSYPTTTWTRDDAADDGATNALAVYEISPTADLTIPGLDAFSLTIPQDQASSEHHYALVLYDRDQKAGKSSLPFGRKKSALHGAAVAASATLTEHTLNFVDASTPIVLAAKHRYAVVLYSDTVTPTPGPSLSPAAPSASGSPLAIPTATATAAATAAASASANALPTPRISYPTASP